MDNCTSLTLRSFLGGVSMTALMPSLGSEQSQITFENFAARAVSGFDVVPRDLMVGARGELNDMQQRAFVAGHSASEEVSKTAVKALYNGMHTPQNSEPERFAYAQARMDAAIEDTVNVPIYCGGAPGYWSEKPASA